MCGTLSTAAMIAVVGNGGGVVRIAICALITAACIGLAAILAPHRWAIAIVSIVPVAPIVVYVRGIGSALVALMAMGLLWSAIRAMRASVERTTSLHLRTHVGAGASRVMMALALILGLAVYGNLTQHGTAPDVLRTSLRTVVTGPILRAVAPVDHTMTVDAFLAQSAMQTETTRPVRFFEDYAATMVQRIRSAALRLPSAPPSNQSVPASVIAQLRAQLSRDVGLPLDGTELVADVFVRGMEKQLQSFATARLPRSYSFSHALALVIAAMITITATWVGTFLVPLWTWGAHGLFAIFRAAGIIHVTQQPVMKDVIAD